ncbi:hypothetical protein niasHS_009071 [Heterodera schachtii]|uniref:Uncharacterized protein n=1 Tax=Heterodera schachtii TaxID=97005 RepID=A0ABD2JEJ7_HETSC
MNNKNSPSPSINLLAVFMCLFCCNMMVKKSNGSLQCRYNSNYNKEPTFKEHICPSDADLYCFSVICDTKIKDEPTFYGFGCANETDKEIREKRENCVQLVKSQERKLPDKASCFCFLGKKGKNMTNRNVIPEKEIPADLLHLFGSPKQNNSSDSSSSPSFQPNLLLLNALLLITAIAVFFNWRHLSIK